MAERVAFLGTGIMGAPMARNLLKAGCQVRVWSRTPDKARVLAAEGADLAETPADAVREAAFVITMLIDAAAVLAVMGQAAESGPDGAVCVRTRRRPRPGTADLRRDRVEDGQARAGGRRGEPHEAGGESLDRGARREPSRPAEPRSALGALAQERVPIALRVEDAQ